MFDKFRMRIAQFIAPVFKRTYAMAGGGRLTSNWRSVQTSANSEMRNSLQVMRGRARELIRNGSYASRAKAIVVNNVVGAGIGMQSQVKPLGRDRFDETVNDAIEEAFCEWSKASNCHTGGVLHFGDFERQVMGQVFETGEVLIRKHYRKFGDSQVPLALELIEAERFADDFQHPSVVEGNLYDNGVETDVFHRPVAYWLRDRHPGETRPAMDAAKLIRVPADQVFHLYICTRWPQNRGVPWLSTAARRMNDMDGYSEAEIVAARGAANYMAVVKREVDQGSPIVPGAEQSGDQKVQSIEPGLVEYLNPGEEMLFNNPGRPNPNMDPFMRMMLREVAAGAGVSYESLSRDYSQSNYSSSRLALLDDRDLWRVLQQWFMRAFRCRLHEDWMKAAVLAGAIAPISVAQYANNAAKYNAVKFKPRGWSWVDPTKEVEAYKEAVRCGFTTVSDVIAKTGDGRDLEDVIDERQRELEMMADKDLVFDTDPAMVKEAAITSAAPAQPAEPPDPAAADSNANNDPPARVVSFRG